MSAAPLSLVIIVCDWIYCLLSEECGIFSLLPQKVHAGTCRKFVGKWTALPTIVQSIHHLGYIFANKTANNFKFVVVY